MESCGMSFIKYLLFIFNLLFAISGIAIIVAGSAVLTNVSDFNHFADKGLTGPPVVLIVAGSIIFIIAFLGCFGAIKESYKMLMAFAALLVIIFIVEFAVGIAAAVYKADFYDALDGTLKKSIERYSDESEKIAWDNLHNQFKCCGVDGPNDWTTRGHTMPRTCCHVTEGLTNKLESYCVDNGIGKYLYQEGCYEKLRNQINSNTNVLIGVGIGIAFIQIIGIVLACWLANRIKKEENSK